MFINILMIPILTLLLAYNIYQLYEYIIKYNTIKHNKNYYVYTLLLILAIPLNVLLLTNIV